jgi:hypothetical protein
MKPLVQIVAALAIVWLASALSACSTVDRGPADDGGPLTGAPVFKEQVERYKLLNGVVWTCVRVPIRNLDGTVVRVEEICR